MKRKSFLTLCALLVVLLLAGPSSPAHAQSHDDGFNPGVNDTVTALGVQADGKIVVGGLFTTLTAAQPLATYRTFGLDKLGKDPRTGESSPPRRPLSFSESGSLTLNAGENSLTSAVIDTPNGFAYFVTGTSPGILVKVRLSDFTRVAR